MKKTNEIAILFKDYLKQIKENKISDQDFLKSVKSLQENIFRVAAILELDLEEETLELKSKKSFDEFAQYSSFDRT